MTGSAPASPKRRSRLYYLLVGMAAGIILLGGTLLWKPAWIADYAYPTWAVPKFECETVIKNEDEFNTCRMYYLSGELRSVGSLKNGQWDGTAKSYFPDGTLRHVKHYRDGEWAGTSYHYWPDGTINQEIIYHDIVHRTEKNFYPTGELWEVSERSDELPHGRQLIYAPDASILSDHEAVEGRYLDENGAPLEGTFRFRYPDGNPLMELRFRDGYLNGVAKGFRADGKLLWKSRYAGSQVNGRYYQYYPNGALNIFMQFKNNNCVHEREYNPQGRLIYWVDIPEPAEDAGQEGPDA